MGSADEVLLGAKESLTRYIAGISSDHSYIHQGLAFTLIHTFVDVAAGSAGYIGITTPAGATGYIHLRPTKLNTSANTARMRFYKAAHTGGVEIIPRNNNQNHQGAATYRSDTTCKFGVTPTLVTDICDATAGGDFGNQPAGDGVEVLSSDNGDTTQTCTIYGTKTGATTTVTSETVTLTGTTFVATTETTWQNILGVELSAVTAGNITVREASADQTITTITAGTTTAGIKTPTSTVGNNLVPWHDASGATTSPVGLIGTDEAGSALTSVDALNGTTEEVHGTVSFNTITKILIGAVAAARDVTINVYQPILQEVVAGAGRRDGGGSVGSDEEVVLEASTDYVIDLSNIGASTASSLTGIVFWYEESAGTVS